MSLTFLFLPLLGGIVANWVFTPFAIYWCHKHDILDRPGHRKTHEIPTPNLGGVAIISSIVIVLAVHLVCSGLLSGTSVQGNLFRLSLVMGMTLFFTLIGYLDDVYDFKPYLKLLLQLVVTVTFAYFYHFEFLQIPGFNQINLHLFAVPFTALWMMAVINGYNFMDGVDGLAGSISAVCLLALGIMAIITNDPLLQVMVFSALGAVLVFLKFNWEPAKIYLGNCGSNLLGALIAAFLVAYDKKDIMPSASPSPDWQSSFPFQVFICSLLVGYPLLEVGLSTFRRGFKKIFFSRSIELSEREHVHHQLLKSGLKVPGISLAAGVLQAIFAAAALFVMFQQRALAVWVLLPALMIIVYAMPRMGFFDFLNFDLIRQQKPHYLILRHFMAMQRVKLVLSQDPGEVLALLNQTCAELGVQYFRIRIKDDRIEGGHFTYTWERPHDVAREYLSYITSEVRESEYERFEDKFLMDGDQGEADWVFEPHTDEDELDVQCRVLVSDFMKTALLRIGSLDHSKLPKGKMVQVDHLSHAKVRSSILRRKYAKK